VEGGAAAVCSTCDGSHRTLNSEVYYRELPTHVLVKSTFRPAVLIVGGLLCTEAGRPLRSVMMVSGYEMACGRTASHEGDAPASATLYFMHFISWTNAVLGALKQIAGLVSVHSAKCGPCYAPDCHWLNKCQVAKQGM
jgi:hypothetical protein